MEDARCWLCDRTLGQRVERHHPLPRARGGRETVPVHPICHRTLHALFDNKTLERLAGNPAALRAAPELQRFLSFIAGKPADFHAPTYVRRRP